MSALGLPSRFHVRGVGIHIPLDILTLWTYRLPGHTNPLEGTWNQAYSPYPCGQTYTSENITFLQLLLRSNNGLLESSCVHSANYTLCVLQCKQYPVLKM